LSCWPRPGSSSGPSRWHWPPATPCPQQQSRDAQDLDEALDDSSAAEERGEALDEGGVADELGETLADLPG